MASSGRLYPSSTPPLFHNTVSRDDLGKLAKMLAESTYEQVLVLVRVLRDKYDPSMVSVDFDAFYQQLCSATEELRGEKERFVRFVHGAYGKRLGIIGLGKVGTEVARRARGFDMDVQFCDAVRNGDLNRSLGVRDLSLEELLSTSDIVSINVTLTPKTRHMIGKKELAMMKEGALLIDTARGAVIDEPALYDALERKTRRSWP